MRTGPAYAGPATESSRRLRRCARPRATKSERPSKSRSSSRVAAEEAGGTPQQGDEPRLVEARRRAAVLDGVRARRPGSSRPGRTARPGTATRPWPRTAKSSPRSRSCSISRGLTPSRLESQEPGSGVVEGVVHRVLLPFVSVSGARSTRPLKIGLMSDYTIVNLGDVENVAPKFQMPEGMDVRFPRRDLGCKAGGVGDREAAGRRCACRSATRTRCRRRST